MHRIVRLTACGAASLALALGSLVVATSPATAAQDTPGCVTKREYRKIHKGMTKKRVDRIFDTRRSWFAGGSAGRYKRTYQSCDFQHAAWIQYKRRQGKPDLTTGWKDWTGAS